MTRRSIFGAFLAALLAPLARWFGKPRERMYLGEPTNVITGMTASDVERLRIARVNECDFRAPYPPCAWKVDRINDYVVRVRYGGTGTATLRFFRPGDRVAFLTTQDSVRKLRGFSYTYTVESVSTDGRTIAVRDA